METLEVNKTDIKKLLVETLMLPMEPEAMGDEQPLFAPSGLGLDSVDALQVVVALDKNFGLKIPNPEAAKAILENVLTITDAVRQHQRNRRQSEEPR